MIGPVDSIAATSVVSGMRIPQASSAQGGSVLGQNDFVTAIANAALDVRDELRSAENVSIAGMRGEASPSQVVDAVLEADRSLRLAIGIRDKVVSAYLEVIRMQI